MDEIFVFLAQEWMLVGVLAALCAAWMVVESRKGGKAVNFHDVTRLLNSDEAVLLDVRDAKEFKAGHIVGAINIPHTKLADRMAELEKHKNKTIVVVDKYGQHAGHCGKLLQDGGFNSMRLAGGMSEWLSQNLPVAKA